jgi:hypothetical protein
VLQVVLLCIFKEKWTRSNCCFLQVKVGTNEEIFMKLNVALWQFQLFFVLRIMAVVCHRQQANNRGYKIYA